MDSKAHQGYYFFFFLILNKYILELSKALYSRQKLDSQLQETQMVLSVNYFRFIVKLN